jgi:PP-loop superfamily ATP-utilizing enzyme
MITALVYVPAKNNGVRAPLMEAGITKQEIYALSRSSLSPPPVSRPTLAWPQGFHTALK